MDPSSGEKVKTHAYCPCFSLFDHPNLDSFQLSSMSGHRAFWLTTRSAYLGSESKAHHQRLLLFIGGPGPAYARASSVVFVPGALWPFQAPRK